MMPNICTENETETFYIDFRGFLCLKFISENNYNLVTIKDLNRYLDIISKIHTHNISSILVDLRNVKGIISVDNISFKLLAKDIRLRSVCHKIAFVTHSPLLTLKINNYITMYRPNVHTKVYNNIENGIEFCKN